MTPPIVEIMRPGQLHARREKLLALVGMTEDELRERADAYILTDDLVAVVDELDEIDFLLGG